MRLITHFSLLVFVVTFALACGGGGGGSGAVSGDSSTDESNFRFKAEDGLKYTALYKKAVSEYKSKLIETAFEFATNPTLKHENASLLIFHLKARCQWSTQVKEQPQQVVIRHYVPPKYQNLPKEEAGSSDSPSLEDLEALVYDQSIKPITRKRRYIVLKGYLDWRHKQGTLFANPMIAIKEPKVSRSLPTRVMTKGEVEKILEVYKDDPSNELEFRNRLILELLFTSSLRRSELVALNVEDFEVEQRTIRVRAGKTKRGRVVPVGVKATQLLIEYIGERSGPIFLNYRGERLSTNAVNVRVTEARKKAKIRTKASSHSFRKTSATLMLKNGAPLRSVQALLGHSALSSSVVYTRVYPKDLFKMHRSKHPREREKRLRLPELG